MSFPTTTLRAANNPQWLPPTSAAKQVMSSEIRYALLPSSEDGAKIRLFATLPQLARAIHQSRAGQTLELAEIEDFEVKGRPLAIRAVEVHTLNDGNDRTGFVGFAYLDNQGVTLLRAALRRTQSNGMS